ncbi:MAG: hypothetical protein U0K18_01220, partial [Acutalibacteraceae bacterium]|nr:hypothetical protein [Acutalibacteraceae bacterium]
DTELLEEFFVNIGMTDSDAECERTELYIALCKSSAMMRKKDAVSFAGFTAHWAFWADCLFVCFFCR